jgi:hypothetical protein
LPTAILRVEGAAIFGLAVFLYARGDYGWLMFALLLLVPDMGLLGYAAGPRAGAISYNAVHTTVGPVVLAAIGILAGSPRVVSVALVWFAHIGMDRGLGLGLQYPDGSGCTHLRKPRRDRKGGGAWTG